MILRTLRAVVHTLGHASLDRGRRAVRASTRRKTIRIGIDIRPFYEPLTGIGWYLHHLLHELARREDVELYLFGDARITDQGPHLHTTLPPNARLCVFDLRGQPLSRFSRPLTAAAFVVWMWLLDCDVYFGSNYFLPRLMSAVARRRVVTVHDLTYKVKPALLQQETLSNLERVMQREIALAGAVICVSESTRRDLLHYYEVDPRRIVTIHSGLPPLPSPEPIAGLPDRYLLFVSTIEPRKNLDALIDAFDTLRASGEYSGSLVVAGRVGWKAEATARRLRRDGIVHLDYVKPSQLAALYSGAEAFVFPSIYEGFGFPMLEAMAQGVPVVAARSSSLPEIGGDAALYFDLDHPEQLTAQIRRIVSESALREELIARGRKRSAEFRWDRAAKETLNVLVGVAGGEE